MYVVDQKSARDVYNFILSHRCYTHPVFASWAKVKPSHEVIGALFHQIQMFCASTRPGLNFPKALEDHGMMQESVWQKEIIDSESDHGPELATMAGYIINQAAGKKICPDVYNQEMVEAQLKAFSDSTLGNLPGYNRTNGLAKQTKCAIEVLEKRWLTTYEATIRNIGVTFALEVISNQHLVPGEKHCLIDSGNYNTDLEVPEMHYLLEHWGELGAEKEHEANAMKMVDHAIGSNRMNYELIMQGATDFLDSLTKMWDYLDCALLQSGYTK